MSDELLEGGTDATNDPAGLGEGGDPSAADSSGTPADGDAAAAAAADSAAQPPKTEPPKFTEAELEAAARKYANGAVAAARRMLRDYERKSRADGDWKSKHDAVEAARAKLEQQAKLYDDDPIGFLASRGEDVRSLLKRIATGEKKTPATPQWQDKIAELEKKLADREAKDKQAFDEVANAQARRNVETALAADARFKFVTKTQRGRDEAWDAVTEYYRLHGECSDEMVFKLALGVEAELASDFGGVTQPAGAAKPASAAGSAKPAGASNGKSIPNNGGSDPIAKKPLPDDDDAARLQVLKELGFA